MNEIWKIIDECYEVSNEGRIRTKERISLQPYKNSFRTHHLKSKILTQQLSNGKYLRVKLYSSYVSVSHLVATAFVPNPNNYTIVHHIDHNPQNNRADNLEWISEKEHNRLHRLEQAQQVYQYSLNGELVSIWPTQTDAAKELGFSQDKISKCCRGERKQHKGFIWSYIPL